jgi:hypothetical protein
VAQCLRFRTKSDGQGTLWYGLCALFYTVPKLVVGQISFQSPKYGSKIGASLIDPEKGRCLRFRINRMMYDQRARL